MQDLRYRKTYWSQIANPWVSASVLVGGLISSILLYSLVHFNNSVEASAGGTYSLESVITSPLAN